MQAPSDPLTLPAELKQLKWLSVVGLIMVLCGEGLRKAAMLTAGSNFNHIVQNEKAQSHVLVTTGVYAYFRHPSYVGWFYWSIGTQVRTFTSVMEALKASRQTQRLLLCNLLLYIHEPPLWSSDLRILFPTSPKHPNISICCIGLQNPHHDLPRPWGLVLAHRKINSELERVHVSLTCLHLLMSSSCRLCGCRSCCVTPCVSWATPSPAGASSGSG